MDIGDITKLYYNYKRTSDQEIAEYLDKVTLVKKKHKGVGSTYGYYKLKDKWINGIKDKPRSVSVNFSDDNVSNKLVKDVEVVETVYYLVKSSSRFFLKADVGEIFDAIGYMKMLHPKFTAIEVDCDYHELLPNTEGEHFLMRVNLLK